MRLPRSPYKRAEAAIDSWDYESEEGQEKARTAAVFTIPVALVLLVIVIVAIVMHLAGAFDPERDAYQEAQSHVEDITRRSERGLDKTRTDKPANGDTTAWTLFPSLPDGASWNASNVAYHDTCLSQRKQVQDALTSRYQYLKTGIYPVAYAPTLTDTPTDCPASLDGYVFLSDGATPVLYVAHMNAGTPDADNVTNMVTANASMASTRGTRPPPRPSRLCSTSPPSARPRRSTSPDTAPPASLTTTTRRHGRQRPPAAPAPTTRPRPWSSSTRHERSRS